MAKLRKLYLRPGNTAVYLFAAIVSKLDPHFSDVVWSLQPNIFSIGNYATKIGPDTVQITYKQNPIVEKKILIIYRFFMMVDDPKVGRFTTDPPK